MKMRIAGVWFVLGAIAVACGGSREGFDKVGEPSGQPGSSDALNQPPPGEAEYPSIGHMQGRVVAPEGTIPVSNALLYLTSSPPPAVPDGTYCDKCVQLTKANPFTYSKADGTFNLPVYTSGPQYLVVQKGAFRRVRRLDVKAGDQAVGLDFTRLPSRTDKAVGDDIPKMAVAWGGSYDKVEQSLVKLGIDKSAFDVYGTALFGQPDGSQLIQDPAGLSKYQILFLPCTGWDPGKQACIDQKPRMGSVQKALRDFVAKGGKLYATDASYEYIGQTFPNFITWQPVGSQTGFGSACTSKEYDAAANVTDPGLSDWLKAIGDQDITLKSNYTTIASVQPRDGIDANGGSTLITPKVWVKGATSNAVRPATVSFDHGCGRVMFSTYHTKGDHDDALLPQEKALLYVLLEVSVCVGPMPGEVPK